MTKTKRPGGILNFTIDTDTMELKINNNLIKIKYYEGLGRAPVITEEEGDESISIQNSSHPVSNGGFFWLIHCYHSNNAANR